MFVATCHARAGFAWLLLLPLSALSHAVTHYIYNMLCTRHTHANTHTHTHIATMTTLSGAGAAFVCVYFCFASTHSKLRANFIYLFLTLSFTHSLSCSLSLSFAVFIFFCFLSILCSCHMFRLLEIMQKLCGFSKNMRSIRVACGAQPAAALAAAGED